MKAKFLCLRTSVLSADHARLPGEGRGPVWFPACAGMTFLVSLW